jgi:hypothetical protein
MSETRHLYELARPFPPAMVEKKPGGKFEAAYVSHGTVTARLLEVLGPFDWTIAKVITNADGIAVGCIGRLEVVVDGRPVVIEEVGDCEHPGPNSASNLKSSSSDSLKRAAMRLGLGLHLWQGDSYYLHRSLEKRLSAPQSDGDRPEGGDTGQALNGAETTLQSVREDVAW